MYQAKSSNLIWNCFDIWNSGRRAKKRVEMTEPKSSNLSVIEKFSWNSPNQVQQLDLKMFWYMEFISKVQKQSWNDGTQVQQLECEWEIVKNFTKQSPATWFESVLIYGIQVEKPKTKSKWRNPSPATWMWIRNCQEIYQTKSSNLSVNEKLSRNLPNQVQLLGLKLFCYMKFRSKSQKQSWNDGIQVQQLDCEWKILKKFTKPSPATWFEIVLLYGIQVEKPKTELKWRNPSPATWMWVRNCQEIYQTNSSNLIWNCFDIWNSGRKAKNRVEMTEPKSSNLSVNEKLSRNLPNQVQQLDLRVFSYMEFKSKSQKQCQNDGIQVQQLDCEWKILKKFTKPSPATWFEIVLLYKIQVEKPKTELKWRIPSPATWVWMRYCQEIYQTKSSNLSVNEKLSRNLPNQVQLLGLKLFCYMKFRSKSQKQSWNDGIQVQQLDCEWKILKKFTKPSPATWFEIVLLYGIQVEKPKTELKWRNPIPATWVWMRNCQEIYQTKSSNWSVNEKLSRNLPNQVQLLGLKLFCYMEFRSKSQKQSWNDGIQVQQLDCEWKILKKFTKPSPATWFEIVLLYGIQVEKPKTELKWRNPSPATWMWMKNSQEIYQTNSSNLIWNCFDIWNSGRKAKNRVEMTEPKSSNLSVNEKLSRNLPNQVQQLDLRVFSYMEFKSKSQKLCQNDGIQVQQLDCEWKILKKFTKPSPATWFEIVLLYKIQVEKPKTELKWRIPSPATWLWMKNCQEIYQTKSSYLVWNCFVIWNSGRKAKNRVEMTEPKSSNLSVNEKLSRNLPNQVQLLGLKLFWYMIFRSKSQKQSWNDGIQVQQLDCEWKILKKFTKPSPATWFEIVLLYGIQVEKPKTELKWRNPSPATWVWMRNCQEIYQTKSSNLSMSEKLSRNLPNQVQLLGLKLFCYMIFRSKSQKQSWNDGIQVQQLDCEWKILKKFTKPSPATWFEIVLLYGIQVEKPKTELKWRNPSPATWVWMRNCQEIYQTKSSYLVWNCFVIWNSGRKAKNRVEMTESKSSNLIVNKKFSRNLPNQVQLLGLKLFCYMEFRSKSQKQSWNDGTQVQQLECEWEIVKKFTKPSPATWFEIVLLYGIQVEKPKTELKWRNPSPATWLWMKNSQEIYQTKSSYLVWNCFVIWNSGRKAKNRVELTEPKSSNLSVNEKLSRNLPNQVQQLECEWEIVKKFTKPSPATWFEIVLLYEIQVEKPKTELKWRNPSPATWLWMKNSQEIYQTKSSYLVWNCFVIWNSGRKAKNRVEMTEPKSSNLSVNEKLSRNLPNQVQLLGLKLFCYMKLRSKSQKQSWNDGIQVQQLDCEWKILKKFTKPSPATWFEIVLLYGIQVEKPKTVEMTEPKSSNLNVNKKLSRNLQNQLQQLDLKLFWYMEFRSKSQKQSWNDGTQVQQLECEWEIVKKFTKPSPATWFESVFIYGIQVKKTKTMSKWWNPSPATWLWTKNSQEIYQTKSSYLVWNCFVI